MYKEAYEYGVRCALQDLGLYKAAEEEQELGPVVPPTYDHLGAGLSAGFSGGMTALPIAAIARNPLVKDLVRALPRRHKALGVGLPLLNAGASYAGSLLATRRFANMDDEEALEAYGRGGSPLAQGASAAFTGIPSAFLGGVAGDVLRRGRAGAIGGAVGGGLLGAGMGLYGAKRRQQNRLEHLQSRGLLSAESEE